MTSPFNSTCINFLNFSGCWLHWSYLDSNWKKEEEYYFPKKAENDVHALKTAEKENASSQMVKSFHQGVHFVLAYATGSFGHALCSVTKIASFVIFIFVNCGFALYLGIGTLTQKITKTEDKMTLQARKLYLCKGLLIMGESLVALFIDVMGIFCPPMAYHTHDYAKMHLLISSDRQLHKHFFPG